MDQTLTLIAAENRATLSLELVDALRASLERLGGETGTPQWLCPQQACDIHVSMLAADQAQSAASQIFQGYAVDVVAQPAEGRRKQVLLADMDSTIVTGETLDELAAIAGIKDHVAAITARAMNGELDFKKAIDERVGLLAGLPETALAETWSHITYTPGARVLVQTMKAHGAWCVLVSGGFRYFTSLVREECGFDVDIANDLEIIDGVLTGKVGEPLIDRAAKLATLQRVCADRKLSLTQAVTVGDGANDLDMIKAAGLGVAFHAKPSVAEQSRVRIDHGDLTALLYAQGYHRDQFFGV